MAKLSFSALVLAAAPMFVVARGAPDPSEATIFALMLAQLLAATLVARRGWLLAGHIVAALGFLGIALVVAAGPTDGRVGACCWLTPAAFEAIASGSRALRRVAAVAALPLATGFVALGSPLGSPLGPSGGGTLLLAGLAMVPALQAALRASSLLAASDSALATARARSQALCEASDAAVIDVDAAGLVERASPACEAMLGAKTGGLSGRGLFEQVQVADRPAFLKLLSDAAHAEGVHVACLRLRIAAAASDGACRPGHLWLEMRAARHACGGAGPDGRRRVVALLRDVSASHHEIAAVDEAKRLVAEAMRSRDEFLANMSHELRTPLNAIIGFSEMLGSHTLCPSDAGKQREYARIILQSGRNLLSVVNTILDMSKIQSGTFALVPESFAVASLLDQCCDMIHLKAEAGRVVLAKDMPDELGAMIGDRRACKQILINLLSNAVKFTPVDGRVTVTARIEGAALRLAIADTGIGVSPADLDKLGQPFFQVSGSICRSYEGTGLGLSVVRGLVGLHGGRLAIESVAGVGTTVTVHLPLDGKPAGDFVATAPDRLGSASPVPFPQYRRALEDRMKQSA